MRRIILNRRKAQRIKAIERSKNLREKYLPYCISLVLIGILLIISRILVSALSIEITSGNVHRNEIIGPVEVREKSLYNFAVEHKLNRSSNNWCSLSILLLDENKNYISGATKDLYYERDYEGSYSESNAEYSIVIKQPGTYFFTIDTKYSKSGINSYRLIKMHLNKIYLGTNYLMIFGIASFVIGSLLTLYVFSDWELTKYIPKISSEYSASIYKKFIFIGVIIFLTFVYSGITFSGYAGANSIHDAPNSRFNNDNNHYFGR